MPTLYRELPPPTETYTRPIVVNKNTKTVFYLEDLGTDIQNNINSLLDDKQSTNTTGKNFLQVLPYVKLINNSYIWTLVQNYTNLGFKESQDHCFCKL